MEEQLKYLPFTDEAKGIETEPLGEVSETATLTQPDNDWINEQVNSAMPLSEDSIMFQTTDDAGGSTTKPYNLGDQELAEFNKTKAQLEEEAYQNQEAMVARIVQGSREVSDNDFASRDENIYAGRVLYSLQHDGMKFDGTDLELADYTLNTMSAFEYTIASKLDWTAKIDTMTNEEILSLSYLIDEFANKDITLAGFKKAVGHMITAPENLFALPTGGGSKVTAVAASRTLATMLADTLRKRTIANVIKGSMIKNAPNAALGSAVITYDSHLRQEVLIKTKYQAEYSYGEQFVAAGFGALAGFALPAILSGMADVVNMVPAKAKVIYYDYMARTAAWASEQPDPQKAFMQSIIEQAKSGDELSNDILRLTNQQLTGEIK